MVMGQSKEWSSYTQPFKDLIKDAGISYERLSSHQKKLIAAACKYHQQGFRIVWVDGKSPFTPNWNNVSQSQTLQQILYTFNVNKGRITGIGGIHTNGIGYLDFDDTTSELYPTLQKIISEYFPSQNNWQRVPQLAHDKVNWGQWFQLDNISATYPTLMLVDGSKMEIRLNNRTQSLLPPSIHPDTKSLYQFNGVETLPLHELPRITREEFENLLGKIPSGTQIYQGISSEDKFEQTYLGAIFKKCLELYPPIGEPNQEGWVKTQCPLPTHADYEGDIDEHPSGTWNLQKKIFKCFKCLPNEGEYLLVGQFAQQMGVTILVPNDSKSVDYQVWSADTMQALNQYGNSHQIRTIYLLTKSYKAGEPFTVKETLEKLQHYGIGETAIQKTLKLKIKQSPVFQYSKRPTKGRSVLVYRMPDELEVAKLLEIIPKSYDLPPDIALYDSKAFRAWLTYLPVIRYPGTRIKIAQSILARNGGVNTRTIRQDISEGGQFPFGKIEVNRYYNFKYYSPAHLGDLEEELRPSTLEASPPYKSGWIQGSPANDSKKYPPTERGFNQALVDGARHIWLILPDSSEYRYIPANTDSE